MVEHAYQRVLMALRSFFRRRTADRELDDELQFHLDQAQEFAAARGDDPSAARRKARRHLGSVDSVKEACRDMRTLRPVEHFLHDLRFGARLLVRGRGLTAVAVVSLALGIGASSIDVRPDWRVVSLTSAASIGTAFAFGLLPATRGTPVTLAESLKAQTRSVIATDRQGGRVPLGKLLVGG